MTDRPLKISIIVPFYNAEKHILKFLDSVKKQTLDDCEVLLIDDGSTDNSSEICRNYCETDKRFTYIEKEHNGPSAARNAGISLAQGKYIAFWDSDDTVVSDALFKLTKIINKNDVDIIFFDHNLVYPEVTYQLSETFRDGYYNAEEVREEILQRGIGSLTESGSIKSCLGAVWRRLFKTDFLRNNNIRFDESLDLYEDRLFCTECFIKAKSAYYMQGEYLYNYYKHPSSMTTNFNKNAIERVNKYFNKTDSLLSENNISLNEDVKKLFVYQMMRFAYIDISRGLGITNRFSIMRMIKKVTENEYIVNAVATVPDISLNEEYERMIEYTKNRDVRSLYKLIYYRAYGKSSLTRRIKRFLRRVLKMHK